MILAVLGWLAVGGSLAVLLGGLIWLLAVRRTAVEPVDDAWEFSLENYSCMNRLLVEEDLAFLQAQKGFRPEMRASWKRDRYRLFRLYLDELKADFQRLHARARALVSRSDAEAANLVGVLMRQEVIFLWAVAGVECRLFLYRAGIGNVSIMPLIEMVDAM